MPHAARPVIDALIRVLPASSPSQPIRLGRVVVVLPAREHRPSSEEGTASGGEHVLVELRAVRAIVAARATPEETAAFGQWLVASAQAAADAAKEGGFTTSSPT